MQTTLSTSLNRRRGKKLKSNLGLRLRNLTLSKDGVNGLVLVLIRVGMRPSARRQKISGKPRSRR
jgi:hypothetical protein